MQSQIGAGNSRLDTRLVECFDDDTLLTSNQTRARVGGVSHMCIWRWQRDDRVKFPQPIQINRRNYWRLGDLRRWQAERSEEKVAA
jgi:predicted DNA-binding transcriptional regulator AlpA